MNRAAPTPTDWKGAAMQKRIAGRYAAERRFKFIGLGAVLLSGAFLAFLLFVMVGNGARGFTYTNVAVPIDFKAMPLTIDKARLSDADADQVIASAGLADIVAFAADEALGDGGSELISRECVEGSAQRDQGRSRTARRQDGVRAARPRARSTWRPRTARRARWGRRSTRWSATASCRRASTGRSSRTPTRPIRRWRGSGAR